MTDGSVMTIDSPHALPEPTKITSVEEPWCEPRIFRPPSISARSWTW